MTLLPDNSFTLKHGIISQYSGLAMGAPSSGLIAELFPQHNENRHLAQLSQKYKIINYFRYVDDILLIFVSYHTDIQAILADCNTLHPNLKFIAETARDNITNYLDIQKDSKQPKNFHIQETSIYRKPTFTHRHPFYLQPPHIAQIHSS